MKQVDMILTGMSLKVLALFLGSSLIIFLVTEVHEKYILLCLFSELGRWVFKFHIST